MLHDGAKDRGLELLPFAAGLGDRDEVGAEKDAAHPWNREQPLSERRLSGAILVADVERTVWQHGPARQELQGGRIGGRLGLDEHGSAPGIGACFPRVMCALPPI